MKILSQQEGKEWLQSNCFGPSLGRSLKDEFSETVCYALPTDSGFKTGLARRLKNYFGSKGTTVFWITGWGIWPNHENMNLFDGYRKSLGETRSLFDAPFHILSQSDSTELECLLDLCFYFFWDAYLLEGEGATAVKISHDEYFELRAKDMESLKVLQERLSDLELKVISAVGQ